MAKRKADESESEEESAEYSSEDSAPPKPKKSSQPKKTIKKPIVKVLEDEEDEQPKPKRTKRELHQRSPSSSTSSKVKTNKEGDKYIDLGKKKHATVRVFKGTALVDIREFYGDEGDLKPGKKGISLTVEQWQILRENVDQIDKLLEAVKT